MSKLLDKENEFVFDTYQAIVLSNYIKHWGMPEHRVLSIREGLGEKIYVYYFPCNKTENKIARIATIGLSLQNGLDGKVKCEYIFILPCDLGKASLESVINYILDIAVHTVTEVHNVTIPRVMPPTLLAPKEWRTKAILYDELRGEHENFSSILYKELFDTQFIWAIPIYESEYLSIINNGIEVFDDCERLSNISVVDVNRESFL